VTAVLALGAAVLGLVVVGPLLNRAILWWIGRHVVVAGLLGRTPSSRELAGSRAPARCERCGAPIEVRPGGARLPALLPWAAAAGRCRRCGASRPRWLAAVELATATGFGLAAARFGWSAELPVVLALVAGLVAASAVDLAYLRIPTPFLRVAGGVAVAAMAAAAVVAGPADALVGGLLGAAVYGGFLLVFHLISPSNLGFGDVRLGVLIGLVVGWLAWAPDRPVEGPLSAVVAAAFVGALVGSVVGTVLLLARRQNRPFPFGPALALGAVLVVLTL